jgi:hypothetical protein
MDPSLAAIRRKRLNKLSHGTAYRSGQNNKTPKNNERARELCEGPTGTRPIIRSETKDNK